MNAIQKAILDVFLAFKKICDDNNLRYYAIGGTCLGAVRHGGFIPWDDDLDVVMPYADYVRFQQIVHDCDGKYQIVSPDTCLHYSENYSKLQNIETTFIEERYSAFEDRFTGIYIDIFPVFGAPKNAFLRHLHIRKVLLLKIFNIVRRFPFSFLQGKKKALKLMPFLTLLRFNFFSSLQTKLLAKYPFGCSNLVFFGWRDAPGRKNKKTYKNLFDYVDFASGVEMPFEDTTIMIPIGYKNYLEKDFGDYMVMPAEEQRVSKHPTIIIDLNKSFNFYKKERN